MGNPSLRHSSLSQSVLWNVTSETSHIWVCPGNISCFADWQVPWGTSILTFSTVYIRAPLPKMICDQNRRERPRSLAFWSSILINQCRKSLFHTSSLTSSIARRKPEVPEESSSPHRGGGESSVSWPYWWWDMTSNTENAVSTILRKATVDTCESLTLLQVWLQALGQSPLLSSCRTMKWVSVCHWLKNQQSPISVLPLEWRVLELPTHLFLVCLCPSVICRKDRFPWARGLCHLHWCDTELGVPAAQTPGFLLLLIRVPCALSQHC